MRGGFVFVLAACLRAEPGYIDAATCRPCHREIFDAYARTAMGRSFSRTPVVEARAALFHAPSGRRYTFARRDGAVLLRRELASGEGAVEKRVDYMVGSGAHSRSYVHRRADGKLMELPVSWYAADGGYFAMSPGYDRPDHSDFRREVPDACLFCHNGYPRDGEPAEGIDCQRCHGPGEMHAARRGAIVNPARLGRERRLEVCMQCHMETSGRSIPDAIRRYGRGPFSYRPGEPLAAFMIYFDRADGKPEDAFTVNHSARGLLRSKCFQRSEMTCTTCHDPHRGGVKVDACAGCHAKPHREGSCAGCHMPKRRTDDAVHVVMTDHHIRARLPEGDLLAPKPERHDRYSGPARVAYPAGAVDAEIRLDMLYMAIASGQGVERAFAAAKPEHPEFFVRLAETRRREGRLK
ncbi:MAG: hypothetical protein ACRD96_00835, partial [Bryobacteraceae bacterium]